MSVTRRYDFGSPNLVNVNYLAHPRAQKVHRGCPVRKLLCARQGQVYAYYIPVSLVAELRNDMCAAGFAAVFEMMRASKKPAVGHNLSLDLAFSLAAFAQPLPLDWKDYKLLVASWCAALAASIPSVLTF